MTQLQIAQSQEPSLYKLLVTLPQRLRRLTAGAYRPEVDGLRFFAIAIVIFGHWFERVMRFGHHDGSLPLMEWLVRPVTGVLLFFSISGFILASQYVNQRGKKPWPVFLKTYFSRRILRIEPPYVILLVATFVLIAVFGYQPEGVRKFYGAPQSLRESLFASLFYLHNILFGTYPRLFGPGWSLEVEVQFYILAPLAFWAYFAMQHRARRMVVGFLILMAGILLGAGPLPIHPINLPNTLARFFPYFWIGILLADFQPVAPKTPGWVGWLGVAVLLFGVPIQGRSEVEGIRTLFAMPAITMMFLSVFSAGSFRSFCSYGWIALIGGACYSIYLTHLQVLQFLSARLAHIEKLPVGIALAVSTVEWIGVLVVGLTFYALIERTFMIHDWPQRAWRLLTGRRAGAARPSRCQEEISTAPTDKSPSPAHKSL